MSVPDFKTPLIGELNLARQISAAARAMLPNTNGMGERQDLASALAHIALEHIAAILALFEVGSIASGYALMRPALETAYKSVWISSVADEATVASAYRGRDAYGSFKNLIGQIEAEFQDIGWSLIFGKIKPHMRALHEQTHSGAEQTLRRLKAQDLRTPNYDFGQVVRDVRTLAGASILVALPIITSENGKLLNDLMRSNYSWLESTASNN